MGKQEDRLQRADAVRRRLATRRRSRGIDQRRLARTLSLGALAAAAAIYWLAVEYGVDMRELAGYLWASVLFVILLAALALGGAIVLRLARKRHARAKDKRGRG